MRFRKEREKKNMQGKAQDWESLIIIEHPVFIIEIWKAVS